MSDLGGLALPLVLSKSYGLPTGKHTHKDVYIYRYLDIYRCKEKTMEKMLWKRRLTRRACSLLIGYEAAEDLDGPDGIQCKTEEVLIA